MDTPQGDGSPDQSHEEHEAEDDVPTVQAEDPLEDQANEEELDYGAGRGEQEPPSEVEAEERRDRPIDQDEKGCEADLVI
jgi:hypothetical protein